MDKDWQLIYEVHYVCFGTTFFLMAGLFLRASVRARNTSFLTKYRVHHTVNGVFVVFATSRAFILLLHRYVNEKANQSSFERLLPNIGLPCLITAYTRVFYYCPESMKGHERLLFGLVVLQFYLFIFAYVVQTMITYDEPETLNIGLALVFCSFLFGLFVIVVSANIFYRDFLATSNDKMKKSNVVNLNSIERQNCGTETSGIKNTRSLSKESIVAVSTMCIGLSCVVIKLGIMRGILKIWDRDMDMDNWSAWMYENALRMIELGNAALMYVYSVPDSFWTEEGRIEHFPARINDRRKLLLGPVYIGKSFPG